MRFTEALREVFDKGCRIARRKWNNSAIYCGLEQGQLCIWGVPADNLWHPWTITESDYFSDDWEVVE